jgi:hypothetical protein
MQEEIASFLRYQIRRSTECGDTEKAMSQLKQFLEREREVKAAALDSAPEPAKIRRLRAV